MFGVLSASPTLRIGPLTPPLSRKGRGSSSPMPTQRDSQRIRLQPRRTRRRLFARLTLALFGPRFRRGDGGRDEGGRVDLERANRRNLDRLIDRRGRMAGVEHLLLAQADRQKTLRRNLEGVYQHFADHVGPPLAQRQIIFAPTCRYGMADDQELVSEQRRMIERIRDASERSVGFRPNHGSVFVEFYFGGELRQLEQVRRDRRPLERRGVGLRLCLDSIHRLLPQRGEVLIRRGVKTAKLADPVFRRAVRLGLRPAWQRHETDQRDGQKAGTPLRFPRRPHQRYPASLTALLQLMLTPRGPANRQSMALPRSPFCTPGQNLATSRSHNLVTADRAATRFWMASKAEI